jgi:hypothetical protein
MMVNPSTSVLAVTSLDRSGSRTFSHTGTAAGFGGDASGHPKQPSRLISVKALCRSVVKA